MKRILIAAVVLLCWPWLCRAEEHRHTKSELVGYWVLGGAHLADASYTMWFLGSGIASEGNPVLTWATEHPGRFAAIKWAGAGSGFYVTWRLFETGHAKLAWASLAAQVAVTSLAVAHNHRVYTRCRQPHVVCRAP